MVLLRHQRKGDKAMTIITIIGSSILVLGGFAVMVLGTLIIIEK